MTTYLDGQIIEPKINTVARALARTACWTDRVVVGLVRLGADVPGIHGQASSVRSLGSGSTWTARAGRQRRLSAGAGPFFFMMLLGRTFTGSSFARQNACPLTSRLVELAGWGDRPPHPLVG